MTLTEVIEGIKATGAPHTEELVNNLIYHWKRIEANKANQANIVAYELAWGDWLKNRDQRIANGLPVKPSPKPALMIHVNQDTATGLPLEPVLGPEFCIEPNPEPTLPTPLDPNVITVRVGDNYPGTGIWRMLPGDTAPLGHIITHEGKTLRKYIIAPPFEGGYKLVK